MCRPVTIRDGGGIWQYIHWDNQGLTCTGAWQALDSLIVIQRMPRRRGWAHSKFTCSIENDCLHGSLLTLADAKPNDSMSGDSKKLSSFVVKDFRATKELKEAI